LPFYGKKLLLERKKMIEKINHQNPCTSCMVDIGDIHEDWCTATFCLLHHIETPKGGYIPTQLFECKLSGERCYQTHFGNDLILKIMDARNNLFRLEDWPSYGKNASLEELMGDI
jgi:hypothetical protein